MSSTRNIEISGGPVRPEKIQKTLTRQEVDELEKLVGRLRGAHSELAGLSKKSPNDGVNKFKLKFINSILVRCKAFLGQQYQPFDDFEQFDAEELFTNSDVAFMLSQYLEAIEKFRSDHLRYELGSWFYDTPKEKIRTAPPGRLKD